MFKIVRGMASSQSKGCLLFIQVGCKALVVHPKWCKRDVAIIHAEIDTPHQRLRVGFRFWQKKNSRRYHGFSIWLNPRKRVGNGYRDRWLKKLGYI